MFLPVFIIMRPLPVMQVSLGIEWYLIVLDISLSSGYLFWLIGVIL